MHNLPAPVTITLKMVTGELEIARGDVDAQISAGHANDTKSPIKLNRGIPVSFRPPNQSAGCCL